MFLIYTILGGLGLLHAVLIHRNLIAKAERRGYAKWHDEEKKRTVARHVAQQEVIHNRIAALLPKQGTG